MKTFFELRESNIQASELDEKLNVNKIHKAVDAGKSMDVIVGMFANKRTTNTDEIRKVVKDYKFKKRMKREEVELEEKFKVGDKVKVKKGSMKSPSQRHYEKTVGTIVKDYGDDDFKVNFGRNDNLSIEGELLVKEEIEIDEKMDPTDHVKKKGDKFCVYNADGSIAKEFDNKEDADKYAIANHDKMMATAESKIVETTWQKDVGKGADSLVAMAKKNGLKAKATGNNVTISGDKKKITKTLMGMRYAYQAFSKGFKEEVELEESMTGGMKRNDPKLVKIFDRLKKGSTIKIKHNSSLEAGKDFIEYIVKSKNMVNKGRVEKVTLATKDNPTAVKKYLYKRDGGVSFAIGDMAGMIMAIKEATSSDAMAKAMADFKKRGGKIKKVAPGKAQGYHGKEDPGTDTHGMLSRGDTSRVGTRKKVRSMGKEETNVDEAGPGLWANIRAKRARGETMRKKGAPGAPTQDAIDSAKGKTEDINMKPPFDNAVKRSTKPTKDRFGNVIKNRARSLARASARKNMDTLNPSTKEKK